MLLTSFLHEHGGTLWAQKHFIREVEPAKAEVLSTRLAFEKLRRGYGIRFEEAAYIGYYSVDVAARKLVGLYPATTAELFFCMLHAGAFIFADPDMVTMLDWLGLVPSYRHEIDVSSWVKCLDELRGRVS